MGTIGGVKRKMKAPQMTTHGGLKSDCPKFVSGMGVKGKKSVNDGAVRSGTAPTPRSLSGRNA